MDENESTTINVKFQVSKDDLRALNHGKRAPLTRKEFTARVQELVAGMIRNAKVNDAG